jgi:hypothetical protein
MLVQVLVECDDATTFETGVLGTKDIQRGRYSSNTVPLLRM